MGTQITKEQETLFSTNLFLYAVCPLLKTILEDKESLQKGWKGKKAVAQISCLDTGGKKAIHYLFENGTCTPKKGVSEEPVDIELEFKSPEHLCSFFKGKLSQALDFFDQDFGNAYRALFVEADISQLHRHGNQQFVMAINFLFHLQARPAQVHHLAGNG